MRMKTCAVLRVGSSLTGLSSAVGSELPVGSNPLYSMGRHTLALGDFAH